MVGGELLCRFDTSSSGVGSTTSENLKSIFFLGTYFFSCECNVKTKACDAPQDDKSTTFKGKPLCWSSDLAVFSRAKVSDKSYKMEVCETLLKQIPNSWSNQAYVQGFDCEYITLKTDVNVFELM